MKNVIMALALVSTAATAVGTAAAVGTGPAQGSAGAGGSAPGTAGAGGSAPAPAPTLRATNERRSVHAVARTPKLEGPDDLEKAPIIVLSSEKIELDGHPMEPKQLEGELATLRKDYALHNPKEPFYGEVVLACAPKTPTERLRAPLREALAAGYPNVLFAFLHEIPGTGWSTGSAVRASIAPMGKKVRTSAGTVALGAYEDCLGLAQALIKIRADEPVVRLDLNDKSKPTAEGGTP
jgi:hypothetical protein